MLSPLKPLLCRHEFYWSERRRAERCRRCGKLGQVEAPAPRSAAAPAFQPSAASPEPTKVEPARRPTAARLAAQGDLKAQAKARRDNLLGLLDQLAQGGRPSRQEAIDAVLAVIEDAHSADPVLFGAAAADHFARLHQARDRVAL